MLIAMRYKKLKQFIFKFSTKKRPKKLHQVAFNLKQEFIEEEYLVRSGIYFHMMYFK